LSVEISDRSFTHSYHGPLSQHYQDRHNGRKRHVDALMTSSVLQAKIPYLSPQ